MAKLDGFQQQPSFTWVRNPQFGQGSAGKAHLRSLQLPLGSWEDLFLDDSHMGQAVGALIHGLSTGSPSFFTQCQVGSKKERSERQNGEAWAWNCSVSLLLYSVGFFGHRAQTPPLLGRCDKEFGVCVLEWL